MPALFPHPDKPDAPYAGAAVHNGTVWACGQVPVRPDGTIPGGIGDQVHVALDNLERTLAVAGADLTTLLKLTVYLADLDEFDAYNSAYLERLSGLPLPPRTTVEVARFRGDKRIEIDAVAAIRSDVDTGSRSH
ncbi:RidA family protein [Amycolatopsis sp. cmx-4-54]|uniref:RidA family protein n=1 Tax=Amycolatopsis sp. cmx-4-54 TaxID=2790936 RepID=UPI00397DC30A